MRQQQQQQQQQRQRQSHRKNKAEKNIWNWLIMPNIYDEISTFFVYKKAQEKEENEEVFVQSAFVLFNPSLCYFCCCCWCCFRCCCHQFRRRLDQLFVSFLFSFAFRFVLFFIYFFYFWLKFSINEQEEKERERKRRERRRRREIRTSAKMLFQQWTFQVCHFHEHSRSSSFFLGTCLFVCYFVVVVVVAFLSLIFRCFFLYNTLLLVLLTMMSDYI